MAKKNPKVGDVVDYSYKGLLLTGKVNRVTDHTFSIELPGEKDRTIRKDQLEANPSKYRKAKPAAKKPKADEPIPPAAPNVEVLGKRQPRRGNAPAFADQKKVR